MPYCLESLHSFELFNVVFMEVFQKTAFSSEMTDLVPMERNLASLRCNTAQNTGKYFHTKKI